MLGPTLICRDVRQVDFGLRTRGKLDLGFFRAFFKALHRQRVTAQIHTLVFLEFICQVIDQVAVKILTAQEGITIGREHLKLVLPVNIRDLND